jgi:hypothetical protein
VGGAASVLSRERALALAGLLALLVAYGALADTLPEIPARADLAVVALLVLPAFMTAIWLALPLVGVRRPHLLIAAAGLSALLWLVLDFAGAGSAANVAKFVAFALAGLWFVALFEELWWVTLVAVIVPWMDVWSVAFGPTRYVVQEQPGFFEEISVAFALPGASGTVNLGPPDVIFFALFLATAERYRLRVGWTWLAMTGFLALTLVLVWEWDVFGLPALPAVCLGFLAANADLLWRNVRDAWRDRRGDEAAGGSEP